MQTPTHCFLVQEENLEIQRMAGQLSTMLNGGSITLHHILKRVLAAALRGFLSIGLQSRIAQRVARGRSLDQALHGPLQRLLRRSWGPAERRTHSDPCRVIAHSQGRGSEIRNNLDGGTRRAPSRRQ